MKKVLIAVIALIIIVAAVVAYFLLTKADNTVTKKTSTTSELPTASVTACDILTKDIAVKILGDSPSGPTSTPTTTQDDVTNSSCVYVGKLTQPTAGTISAKELSVTARIPRTKAAWDANIASFNAQPSGTEPVTGVGDKAFFYTIYGQLDVLKGGNWYVITQPDNPLAIATLDQDKALAAQLTFK